MYQYYIKGDKNFAAQELAKALLQTSSGILKLDLPINKCLEQHQIKNKEFHTKKRTCLLSGTELENLLALVRVLSETKKLSDGDAFTILCWCKNYINDKITNSGEHAKIFCKCAWLLSNFYIINNQDADAFELCDSAFEELQDFGISYFMQPLLRQMLECKSVYAFERKKKKYQHYLDTLDRAYNNFGIQWFPQDSILYHPRQNEYFLDYEIIKGGRLTMGLTQETMISDVFTSARTLSQIENCKSHPSQMNFRKLLKNLNLKKTRFNTTVLTDSAELLRKAQELRRLTCKGKHIEMERPIRELEKALDMSLLENQRFIRYFENVIDYTSKNRKYEEVLQEDYYLLQKTYDLKNPLYRTPFRLEAEYINQIALMLKKTGQKEKSIDIYKKVLNTYHKSKIKEEYHFAPYSVMLGNLVAGEESLELSKRAIQLALKCGKIHLLHYDYMTYLCALEKTENVNQEDCRTMLEDTMTLCSLVKNKEDFITVRQYYEERYGEK